MSGTPLSSSTPLSTMKTIQKRLYTVLQTPTNPRVRSNSASRSLYTANSLSFFDTPPSPRPNVLTTTRLAVEARGEVESGQNVNHHLPFSLALTAPNHNSPSSSSGPQLSGQYSLFPYSTLTNSASKTPAAKSSSQASTAPKRQRFQLDIGAYGIPKRRNASYLSSAERQRLINGGRRDDNLNLAVQVGEDAYFIRENAMGVADGVGGWNKVRCPGIPPSQTPSGLFARRLMHFCASELDSIPRPMPPPPLSPFPRSFQSQPRPSPLLSSTNAAPWYWSDPPDPLEEAEAELQEHLEELEEGIDVLMILERAYQTTLKEHVVPPPASEPPKSSPVPPSFEPGAPLLAGSSTALLAVLDHVPKRTSETALTSEQSSSEYEAVIKIAHIGDCMGMLVRDDEIVWRSEEMWWSFNTPVQLSALPSSSSPWSSAHTFTLPVQADDVLILASDGLSDNLWDEDILDEVARFRKGYLQPSSAPTEDSESSIPTTAAARIRWRQALASMLSEALCSRARRVSERRQSSEQSQSQNQNSASEEDDEVPFARRARENGRVFRGGKHDDISVVVAVISPVADLQAA